MTGWIAAQTGIATSEAFLAGIENQKFECSFRSYPQLRYSNGKIEALAADQILTSLSQVTQLEPGILQAKYRDGSYSLFVFSDDLKAFVIGTMSEMSSFSIDGAPAQTKLPSVGTSALEVSFQDHPFWKKARIHADRMEIQDDSGKTFATNPTFSFFPQVHGVGLPEKGAGMIVLSRQKPGTGWYFSGKYLGTGVRTDESGYFRTVLRGKLTGFVERSVQFGYALLQAEKEDLATGQEFYSARYTEEVYGPQSEQVGEAWNQMGLLRGYRRSYAKAPEYHQKAYAHVKQNFGTDKPRLLKYGTDLAASLNDAGDFAGAKNALSEVYSLLPADGADFQGAYTFYLQLAMAEFGLKNYAQSANHLQANLKRSQASQMDGYDVESLLYLIACQIMQKQDVQAMASLTQCMSIQDARSQKNPGADYDTWKLAFACVALGKNEEAVKYSPVAQRRIWVAYEEYGRMVSLLNSGDRAGAQTLAKEFIGRFSNLQEINIRNDIDPITVKLTRAIADPTPANIGELEQTWSAQVGSLKNRPLKNFIFARVMVATLAKLKGQR